MSEYPLFDPEHPSVFPIDEVDGRRILILCKIHQCIKPENGGEVTPEMLAVRAEVRGLCDSFNIKVEDVFVGKCKTCFMKEVTGNLTTE